MDIRHKSDFIDDKYDGVGYYEIGSNTDLVISSSTLKCLYPEVYKGIPHFKRQFDYKDESVISRAMNKGTMLHAYIENRKLFDVGNVKPPPIKLQKTLDYLYKNASYLDLKDHHALDVLDADIVSSIAKQHEYYAGYADSVRIMNVCQKGHEYFEYLKSAEGKVLLTDDDMKSVKGAYEAFKGHSVCSQYFKDDIIREAEVVTDEMIDGVRMILKSKVDMIHYEVINGIKTRIISDVKSVGKGSYSLLYTANDMGYIHQLAFYKKICNLMFGECKTECRILACSLLKNNDITVYKISDESINQKTKIIDNVLRGLTWNIKNNRWDMSRYEHLNNGMMIL
jgi:hypothetical protein